MGISMGDGRYFDSEFEWVANQHQQQDVLGRQQEQANQAWLGMHPLDKWLWMKQNVT
jgi:hypothetical protein